MAHTDWTDNKLFFDRCLRTYLPCLFCFGRNPLLNSKGRKNHRPSAVLPLRFSTQLVKKNPVIHAAAILQSDVEDDHFGFEFGNLLQRGVGVFSAADDLHVFLLVDSFSLSPSITMGWSSSI